MKYTKVDNGADNVILFFSGWSTDAETVHFITSNKSHDWLLVYDYRDLSIPLELTVELNKYDKKRVVAWSFGVWIASYHMNALPSFQSITAINGTLSPVDDLYGIPRKIFALTLRSIKREGIDTFNKRMCGDNLKYFVKANRSFEEQVEELEVLGSFFEEHKIPNIKWDKVLIGGKDMIFPPENMKRYWIDKCDDLVFLNNEPHFIVKF